MTMCKEMNCRLKNSLQHGNICNLGICAAASDCVQVSSCSYHALCSMVLYMMLVSVLLPPDECKAAVAPCSIRDPLPILHKYFQSGDVVIAGIMSQIYITSSIAFDEPPTPELFDDIL
ncbi:Hypothetical predicted protein [Podarcis lilfordi]|uniref:Uncharacterized protein n=1 Tax=Podarcis lilfordi TaxID=74358 RepID=A0AA35PQV9_9SAUR|nr:Hypothetical predicted protein [Podarcis lilfordi]